MAIVRTAIGEVPYTQISNELLNDETLSAEALGVLVYLISKPHNWRIQPRAIGRRFGCGRDKIYRILNDLIEAGYAAREQDRTDEDGTFSDQNYVVFNVKSPRPGFQEAAVEPHPDSPRPENPPQQKKDSTKERKKDSRPAKQQDGTYPEEFEALWKIYPRTRNTSKKKAHDIWRMLSVDNQGRVRAALPIFAADMKREGRPEDKILHMTTWLNGRTYETAAAPVAEAAKASLVDWHKTATREQWVKVALFWRMNYNWKESWGPAPGRPGCMFPEDLLSELEKHQISLVREPRNKAQAAE